MTSVEYTFQVHSLEETHELARLVAENLSGGEFIGFCGPLGAGKTEFVRGLGRAFGIEEDIVSPSFVLEAIYSVPPQEHRLKGLQTLHHWDLYRLKGDELCGELFDYRDDKTKIVVIEWADRIAVLQDLLSFTVVLGFTGFGPPVKACPNSQGCAGELARRISFVGVEDEKLRLGLENYRFSKR